MRKKKCSKEELAEYIKNMIDKEMRRKKYSEEAIRAALAKYFDNMTISVKSINNTDIGLHIKFDNPVDMRYNCGNADKTIDHIVDVIKEMEGRK